MGAVPWALLAPTPATAANFSAGQPASLVLGAPSLTSPSRAPLMDRGFEKPESVSIDGAGRVLVSDYRGHRLGIYNSLPATDGAPFDVVVGKPSKFDYRNGCSATDHSYTTGGSSGGGRLAAANNYNYRVLLYDTVPTADGAAANRVLGQTALNLCNLPAAPTASSIRGSGGVWTDGTKVLVADYQYSRVLVWNTWPTVTVQVG